MSVPSGGYASALRREIVARNQHRVSSGGHASVSSYGRAEVVVYAGAEDGSEHGNFFPASYAAILAAPQWRKRLSKAHTGKRHLPKHESDKWRELDSCTSSDALLMNVFCHPRTLADGRLHRLLGVDADALPDFGIRVAARLQHGHRDRTEIDMRFGDLLVEAKLTENDFQSCRLALVERYEGWNEIFDPRRLPQSEEGYRGYQLIRSLLAAHASGDRFCLIADARRPDLREQWFAVAQAVQEHELRLRCQMLTWQEIAAVVPDELREWLAEKYGIFAPGCEPQLDASEWYW